ncbi:MAG: hypothetical protein KAY65_04620 [Planctomycetes bacterium]|nr:hypothetical protein [Planctomycetota bacterium]
MRQNARNNEGGANRLFSQLAAEKKKGAIALCLIAVMAVMWVKVLTKEGPESAEARFVTEQTDAEEQLSEALKISFVELPEVPGRNDMIGRDFFDAADWQDFKLDQEINSTVIDIEEVSATSTDVSEEVVAQLTQLLKLQAIGLGETPQAFINDKLLSVGDKMVVGDATETYECEVVEISKSTVLIRCRDVEMVLKLDETVEGDS